MAFTTPWVLLVMCWTVSHTIGIVYAQDADTVTAALDSLLNNTDNMHDDTSSAYKQLWAPGHALSFDGQDDYFSFEAATGTTLPDSLFEEATFSVWYQHIGKSNLREALMGFGQEEGPSIHMGKSEGGQALINITPVTSWEFSDNNNCSVYNSVLSDDEQWHHVVMSYSRTSLLIVTDGQLAYECNADTPIPNQWAMYDHDEGSSKAFLFGRYSVPSHGRVKTAHEENSLPMYGLMDDMRVYSRALDLDDILQIYHSAPNQPVRDLMVWFDFANGGPNVEARYSSIDIFISTGGGYKRFSPTFVESRAPLYTFNNWRGIRFDTGLHNAPTFYRHTQLTHDATQNVVVIAPVYDRLTHMVAKDQMVERLANVTIQSEWKYLLISNATVTDANGTISTVVNDADPGVLGLANGSVVPMSALPIVVDQTSVVFAPKAGYFGSVTIRVQRLSVDSLTPTENETTDYMNMQMDIMKNWAPQAGNAGYAIECDGFNDYLYAPYFKWPVGNYTSVVDNITRFGGGPITVEGWSYVIKDHVADSVVWSIGSGEQAKWNTDERNPYKKTGRLMFAMPSSARPQKFRFDVGSLSRTSAAVTDLGGTWVHFAVVHSQVSGTSSLVYLNGQLASSTTHNHTGVGTLRDSNEGAQAPHQRRVEGFSVCTWMFWSGVFHRGAVDEIRIWNYTKTQEEIQRDMYISLLDEATNTLREPMDGLMGYWTFDEVDPSFAYDYSGNNNHLRAAGCAVCDDGVDDEGFNNTYYQGWNTTAQATVCEPIAQSSVSDWYTDALVYGGAYCYYSPVFNASLIKEAYQYTPNRGNRSDGDALYLLQSLPGVQAEVVVDNVASLPYNFIWSVLSQDENPAAVPLRIISGAPLGTHLFTQIVLSDSLVVTLNGTDREAGTLVYRITKPMSVGNMTYIDELGRRQHVVANEDLPQGVRTVTIDMDPDVGGGPFYFEYQVFDMWLFSEPAVVSVYSTCGGGRYVDYATFSCVPCPAGTYSNSNSLRSSCSPCPNHTAQDMTGQNQCLPCQYDTYSHDVGAIVCHNCSDLTGAENVIQVLNNTHPLTVQSDGACEMLFAFSSTDVGVVLRMLPTESFIEVEQRVTSSIYGDDRADYAAFQVESKGVDIMEYIGQRWTLSLTSYPRTGDIYQVEERADGSMVKVGEPMLETISTPSILYSSYVANILNPLPSYDDGDWTNACGLPDIVYFKPFKYTSSLVIVDVQFEQALYPDSIDLFMKPLSAQITNILIPINGTSQLERREDLDGATDFGQNYKSIWKGVQPASDVDNKVTITMCPVVIKSDVLRLVFESTSKPTASSFGGVGVYLDAVRFIGVRELVQRPWATISDDHWRIFYQPVQGRNTNSSVSFSFVATPCDVGNDQALPVALVSSVMPSTGELGTGIIIVCWLLVGLSELLVVSGLIAVVVLRNTPRLRRASPLFIGIMLVGALIALPAPLIAYLEVDSVAVCMIGVTMWHFGFILTFGSLFIKTYRVRMIFGSSVKKLRKGIKCSDRELLTKLSVLLVVNALFLGLYFGLFDYQLVSVVIDNERWQLCPQSWGLLVIILFQGIVMVLGAVLAYQVRKVPSDFKESAFIGLSIYNWLFVSVIALSTLLLTPSDGNTDMTILCVYMVLIFMVTLWFLVGYKLWLLYKERNKPPSRDSTSRGESVQPHQESSFTPDQDITVQSQPGKGAGVLRTPHIAPDNENGSSQNFSGMMFTSSGGALLAMPKNNPNRSSSPSNGNPSNGNPSNGIRSARGSDTAGRGDSGRASAGGNGNTAQMGSPRPPPPHSNVRLTHQDRSRPKEPNEMDSTIEELSLSGNSAHDESGLLESRRQAGSNMEAE